MAIYYKIESEGIDPNTKFEDKCHVCLTIRSKNLKTYKVFEKDDSHAASMNLGTAVSFPLAPMCNDITDEIKAKLEKYRRMEEGE